MIAVLLAALTLGASLPVAGPEVQGQTASPAIRPDSAIEATTAMLAGELRCPVCQGNSIKDSPSEMAQEMRNLIRDQLSQGRTPDEVRSYFVSKYGEWVLLEPRAEGLNLVVYLVPVAVLAVGGLLVWRSVRRWTAID